MSDARIVALSPAGETLFGLAPASAIGRTAVELGLWRDVQERNGILDLMRQRGCAVGEPVSIRAPNGQHYDGLLSCTVIELDGESFLFALIQDIRQHVDEAHARIRENGSFRSLIMDSEVGVYRRRVPPPFGLLDVNPALASLLGCASTEALLARGAGLQGFDYVDPGHAARVARLLAERGRLTQLRAEIRRYDGGTTWVSESARAVRGEDGALLYVEGTLVDITVQVHAEQALMQSEALYRNLVENSRDGVFLMQHGCVQFANDALGTILGRQASELIGASYFDWVLPEDIAAQAARRNAREAGSTDVQEYEIRLRRSDGSTRLCAVRAGAVSFRGAPASIGTLRDVTEVRAQQRRLEAAEERYRLLFKHAVLGMFQSTLDGRIIEVNDAMAQMFGYASPEAMTRAVPDMRGFYVDPDARAAAVQEIQAQGQIIGREFEMYRADGQRFWALSSARIVRHGPDDPGHLEGSLLDNSARRAAEQELKFLAHHDSLTALANRRSFELALNAALAELRAAPGQGRAVLLLDLDRFKLVNDSLGHAAGDELLVKFAERLKDGLDERALLARYGGDEFALLSRAALDERGAVALAQRVQNLLGTPFQLRGHQVFTGASIGIVLVQDGALLPEEIMRDADTAMFRAKAGGGGHALFDGEMHSAARERLALETELRFALERGELLAFYQPLWSLETRRIVGVEALVRWQHPQRGLLLPGHFLNVAEETGMLPAIDLLMLEQALQQFVRWQQQYGANAPQRLSVNVSDRLFGAGDFPHKLKRLLASSGAPPASVHLEITETVFRSSAASLRATLASLKALGVKLVVDDFGTGYSSLVSFSDSAFDGLKIDRGFIHDLESNPRHRAIVRTIAQFAHDLSLSLVAEGVENDMQVQLLRQLGCEYAQGFSYAPALAAGALGSRFGPPVGSGDERMSQRA